MAQGLLTTAKHAAKSCLRLFGLEIRRAQPVSRGSNQPIAIDRLTSEVESVVGWPNRPVAFILVSSNHGTMIINRNDYCMTDQHKGFGVGFDILNKSSFDSLEVQYLLALLS